MKKNILLAICAIGTTVSFADASACQIFYGEVEYHSVIADTIDSVATINDTIVTSLPTATTVKNDVIDFNAVKFVLEKRYRNYGEQFTKRWDDHLFLELGAGAEQMVAPDQEYGFGVLTTAHIGVGKQFNKYHSLRATINGAFGTQRDKDRQFIRVGGRLDHTFSLSSYFDGYNPSRLADVSTLLGVGCHLSRIKGVAGSGPALEGHAGLQFRFFTGPQGYLDVEPYIGVGQDVMDMSEGRNWRRYDMFYGANLSFVYYIHNNLSLQSRERLMRKRRMTSHELIDSTKLQAWRTPLFFEISSGVSFMSSPTLGVGRTLGNNVVASVGKWFSPVIGVRFSTTSSTFTWSKEVTPETLTPLHPKYIVDNHSLYYGLRAEAMFNPLGFSRRFSWNAPFGGHILAGGELGWLIKEQDEKLSCHSEAYVVGVNLWTRLNGGIRLFVEPRFMHYEYKIPYKNVKWGKAFADDCFELNLGLAALLGTDGTKRESLSVNAEERPWTLGIGGGFTFLSTKRSYEGGKCMNWNGVLYGCYMFNRYVGSRIGFEFLSLSGNFMSRYTDYNIDFPYDGYIPTSKTGLWKRNFFIGIPSVDVVVDMRTLCGADNNGNLWRLDFYGGPALCIPFGEKCEISPMERRQPNHLYLMDDEIGDEICWGANVGVNLSYRLGRNVSLFLSPTLYIFGRMELPNDMTRKIMLLETINSGVQLRF